MGYLKKENIKHCCQVDVNLVNGNIRKAKFDFSFCRGDNARTTIYDAVVYEPHGYLRVNGINAATDGEELSAYLVFLSEVIMETTKYEDSIKSSKED